jgi:hypothetical protein
MSKYSRVILDHRGTIVAVVFVVLFAWIQHILTNAVAIRGNYGELNLMVRQILDVSVLVLLFGLIKLFVYKYIHVGGGNGDSGFGLWGGILSLIVTGCPACSIWLASYLGLSAFISWLPYDGVELKVISVLLMWYAVYDMWRKLDVCEISKSRKVKRLEK